jgi:anaerobic selenocysteine-containing dehydrogenase
VHLVPPALDSETPHGLYRYGDEDGGRDFPLRLISPATSKTISSTFGQLDKEQIPLELNPRDAGDRSISDDQQVRAFNQYGEVQCRAVHNPDLPAGVVLLPKGLWSHNTLNGNTANALSPDCLADLGGGACFNDATIEVELLEGVQQT